MAQIERNYDIVVEIHTAQRRLTGRPVAYGPGEMITRVLLCVAVSVCLCDRTVVHQWDEIDLSSFVRDNTDGIPVPENNVVHRIKIWNDTMYMAVPRFRRGVPATLCSKSVRARDGGVAVRPYPSSGLQTVGNCFALQNVRDIEFDHLGQLWSLDAGRVYDLEPVAAAADQDKDRVACDPKLFVVDVAAGGAIVRSAVVPAGLYTTRSVFSGIAIDLKTLTAVVADVGPDDPGFIVYNLRAGVYRKFRCRILKPAADDGYDEAQLVISPIDDMLYFTTIRLDGLYSMPLSVLSDRLSIVDDVTHYANAQGPKADTSTAMAMSTTGHLYVGMTHKVIAWNTARNRFDAADDQLYVLDVALDWISGFAFDTAGYLWIVSSAFGEFLQQPAAADRPNPKITRAKVFKSYCNATSFALQQLAADVAVTADNGTAAATVPVAHSSARAVKTAATAHHVVHVLCCTLTVLQTLFDIADA